MHRFSSIKTLFLIFCISHAWVLLGQSALQNKTESQQKNETADTALGRADTSANAKIIEQPSTDWVAPSGSPELYAANPAEGMNIMQPPSIDKSGDAIINYPLAITPGRNGMTPQLALTYNSSQGTGMLGVGWNIATPKVVVDTRWGVPQFSTSVESELYSLNGSGLCMEGQVRANRPDLSSGPPKYTNRPSKNKVRFFDKTMTSYKETVRHGTSPKNYFWVETTADQTKYYYGTKNGIDLDTNSIFTDPSGNIAEWMLTKVVDKWDNEIEYEYKTIKGTTSNAMLNGGIAKVVKTIYYTGHNGTKGKYSVHFEYAKNRTDATTNLRYGFKVVDEARLEKVVAKYDGAEYRNFTFDYGSVQGAFGKTLLRGITENRHGQEFYKHEFGYIPLPPSLFPNPFEDQKNQPHFYVKLHNYFEMLGLSQEQYYLNKLPQTNLLQTVTNPIGGSFTLQYDALGNRYGETYDPIIQNPTLSQPNNEKMLWDMAQQKQVLKSVTVYDDLEINQNGLNDGPDHYTTTFRYDGGIYSRREREFLGFTRIETTSPSRNPNDFLADDTTRLMHTVSVVEFSKPESNSFSDRANFEYLAGLPIAVYDYNRVFYSQDQPGSSQASSGGIETFYFKRLTQATYNTYTYYPVEQSVGNSFNKAILNDFLTPEDLNVGEAACIFPALTETETFVFLDPFVETDDSLRHYSYKYDLTYDSYLNPIRVIEQSRGEATLASWNNTVPNEFAYYNGDDTPYPVKTIKYTPIYLGQLIAEMDYFAPDDGSAYQTNMLQEHRIYETSTAPANLRRKSTVDQLNANGQAPELLSQWLSTNATSKHTTKIEYNTNGTVSKVTGPPNNAQNAQQAWVSYNYDAPNGQYITQISNVYGDQTCMDYNYATGTPKYTIDPNRYVMYFEYDTKDRPKRVYAPREYADATAPYTIEFEYFEQIDAQNPVPWAVTRHYTGHTQKAQPTTTCALPAWQPRTSVPNPNDIIETATFIDGLGRVVQVKKDASQFDPATQTNKRVREVSGLTTYNWMGMQTQTLMSQLEPITIDITKFNLLPFTNPSATQVKYEYDLMNRVKAVHTNAADDPAALSYADYTITTNYAWDKDYQNKWFFVQELKDNAHNTPVTRAKKYFDSRGQVVATKTIDNSTGNPDILTQFTYDALGQMTLTTNPIGLQTQYAYDWFGRAYQEIHPDRGTTTSAFDKAGNVTSIATDNATVTMTYDYNRLKTKNYPQTGNLNSVTYTYGHLGDGKNGAGRITGVTQGFNVVQEAYAYDELGNVVTENKTIAIPLVGEMKFITKYQYDSWGRLREIKYPDDERVAYTYLPAGELLSVQRTTNNGPIVDYVTAIGYDGFGNQQYLLYGNRVETTTDYNPNNRSLASVKVMSNTAQSSTPLIDKTVSYNNNGNIKSITNTATSYGQGWNDLGGSYTHTYTYDFANRLTAATHQYSGQTNNGTNAATYQLNMAYNPAGGITNKTQNLTQNGAVFSDNMEYQLQYHYQNGGIDHKLQSLTMQYKGQQHGIDYMYDPRGNVTCIQNHPELGNQSFIWDEADRLQAVQNEVGIHHYVYDHTGTRILKGSLIESKIYQEGEEIGSGYTLTPYTVYPNAYTVCTFYADDVDVTNHYYAGAQRVASKLYQSGYKLPWSLLADPDPEEPNGPEGLNPAPQQPNSFLYHTPSENNAVLYDGLGYVLHNSQTNHPCPININLEVDELINKGLPQAPQGTNYYPTGHQEYAGEQPYYPPCNELEDWQNFDPNVSYDPSTPQHQHRMLYIDCICRNSPELALQQNINCQAYTQMYWYHPDYLGNTEFVTDAGGYPYQFFFYSAFGESLVQQHANTGNFATPYKFNAKELDLETGNYYYGARYYNPQTSIWFGVDPLAEERSWLTPYNFVQNNPIERIDPSGMLDTKYEDEDGNIIIETNDGSDDVIKVPKSKEDNFKKLVEVTPKSMSDSKDWNDHFKAMFLGFESTDDLWVLDMASTQWSRQKLIEYHQHKNIDNWVKYLGAEVLSQNANPINHLPTPINVKGSPKIKVPQNVGVKTPSVQTTKATPTNYISKHSWHEFNRAMGAGRFTKDKFGGSSIKANEARMKAYYQWKEKNN